jgi:hypothetical protein
MTRSSKFRYKFLWALLLGFALSVTTATVGGSVQDAVAKT